MFRKGISLLLAAVLMLGILTASPISAEAVNAAKPLPALTGNYPQDIVNVAKSQIGYVSNGGTIYGKWWTEKTDWGIDYTELNWCSMFACWVMEKAGLGVNYGYCWDGASVTHLYEWYRDNMDTCSDFSEEPRPGDFIFFRSATGQVKHVATVIAYNPDTRVVTFVGGNQGGGEGSVTKNWCYYKSGTPRPDVEQYVLCIARSKYATGEKCIHKMGAWTTTQWPTCTGAGKMVKSCTKCDYSETQTIAATGHKMGQWDVTTAPTCTAGGRQERVCSECGHTESQDLVPTAHPYSTRVTKPTCTNHGYTAYSCPDCGEYYLGNHVQALGHKGTWEVVTMPTMLEEGIMMRKCTVCGELEANSIAPLPLPFRDVAGDAWYEDPIRKVYVGGWMQGMSSTEFWPNSGATRAMLVTILWRLESCPEAGMETPFTDLSEDWYAEAVAWAYENEIVLGKTETLFAPGEALTRQQMAAIFHRYSAFKGYDMEFSAELSDFPDWERADEYALEPLRWAIGAGLIQGVTQTDGQIHLDPQGQATRAQLATILVRYFDYSIGTNEQTEPEGSV